MSGVSYTSASLGTCTLHQMYYDYGGETTIGFCGTKGGGMGTSLIGQTWGSPKEITDPSVQLMMAYYYAHSTGTFTDQAHSLGVDTIWDAGYTWYMNAWVQAILWRYQAGTFSDPVRASAEELMYVYNSLEGTHYTSIDDLQGDTSFRDRTQYIFDLGNQGVWGDCKVYEYSFTGAGSSTHPANTVQKVVIGDLSVGTTEEVYSLIVKKVDATNPTKGLSGAKFHIEATVIGVTFCNIHNLIVSNLCLIQRKGEGGGVIGKLTVGRFCTVNLCPSSILVFIAAAFCDLLTAYKQLNFFRRKRRDGQQAQAEGQDAEQA